MKLLVHSSKLAISDVRIDLGRTDVGMAEEHLDGTQVGPIAEEIGSEAVSDHMRRHFL